MLAEIEDAIQAASIPPPLVVFIGATGGLREALSDGRVSDKSLDAFRSFLLASLPSYSHNTFAVITGEDEAGWELAAAHIIYNPLVRQMFAVTGDQSVLPGQFGLFSGGGSSMQVQE